MQVGSFRLVLGPPLLKYLDDEVACLGTIRSATETLDYVIPTCLLFCNTLVLHHRVGFYVASCRRMVTTSNRIVLEITFILGYIYYSTLFKSASALIHHTLYTNLPLNFHLTSLDNLQLVTLRCFIFLTKRNAHGRQRNLHRHSLCISIHIMCSHF